MEQQHIDSLTRPLIAKYVDSGRHGIQSHSLSRYGIGYVLRGEKYIYNGDKRERVGKGELFFLGIGNHYTEEFGEEGKPFEQIIFYYSQKELSTILIHLNIAYGLKYTNNHQCPVCKGTNYAINKGNSFIRNFFLSTNGYLREEFYAHDQTAENIKMTELIYLILSSEGNCIKSKLLSSLDTEKESFEQVIYNHVFHDVSIDELASRCHRSLTAFKKEFKKLFMLPPHQWFIRERLKYSRILLISTGKSISQIGSECAFPNTSHFIKLFKKEYGYTPAFFRKIQLNVYDLSNNLETAELPC